MTNCMTTRLNGLKCISMWKDNTHCSYLRNIEKWFTHSTLKFQVEVPNISTSIEWNGKTGTLL